MEELRKAAEALRGLGSFTPPESKVWSVNLMRAAALGKVSLHGPQQNGGK